MPITPIRPHGTHTRPTRRGGHRPFREEPARLELTCLPDGDRTVLSMAGTLDVDSAVAVETQYDQLIHTGCGEVVLDLSAVTGVDTSGAVALALLWAHLRVHGVRCLVRGLHPSLGDTPLDLLVSLRSAGSWTPIDGPRPTPSTPGTSGGPLPGHA